MDRISIVVPCFNEEEALPVYYREMKRVMGELSEVSFEILFVDDGSSDKTLEILKQLNADLLSTQEKLNSFEVKVPISVEG